MPTIISAVMVLPLTLTRIADTFYNDVMGDSEMKSYSSREIIEILESNGWVYKYSRGSHNYYTHAKTREKITVPHPKKDIPKGTLKSISKQAGIIFE